MEVVLMLIAIALAMVAAGVIISSNKRLVRQFRSSVPPAAAAPALQPGVTARVMIAGETREFEMPRLDLDEMQASVAPTDSLDAVSWEGEFIVRFRPGRVRYARIGAQFQGGSLIVMRGDVVLLSDYASGDAPKIVLTLAPVHLTRSIETLRFIFTSEGAEGTALRALWQPEDEERPRPIMESPSAR